jgi:methyl-accepting chemotaxis protein
MGQESSRFDQRIVGRMLLGVVVPVVIVIVAVVALNAARSFSTCCDAAKENLQVSARLAGEDIEDGNHGAVTTARRMAEAQIAAMFGDRTESIAFARAILDKSPEFTAAYFCYEPNADGKDAASLGAVQAEAMDVSGRFLPYWFRPQDGSSTLQLEPSVDMETSLYYDGVRKAYQVAGIPEAMITEPYVYQGKMIVEQTFPIIIDGQFKGVAGVDRALADVEQDLRNLAAEADADAYLISAQDKFIAATTDPPGEVDADATGMLKTRRVADTPYAELFRKVLEERPKSEIFRGEDPVDGKMYYFATSRIRTGDWKLILRQSEQKVLQPVWMQLREGSGLAAVGLVAIVIIILIMTVRLSRRINRAVDAAERVARGDLAVEIHTDRSHDEAGILLRAINTMMGNLNNLVGKVRQASIQLHSTATELAASSREQESTASSFGATTSEIAAAAKQISATSSELVQTMAEVNRVANDTASLATSGRAGLQSMEATMRGLDDATGSVADKLAVINEKASNITGVVTTITKVADQTNLLSVNAAIEAEKAGEYGVGFLVVAREIRRLADQTAAATLDIEQMVQQMESAVSAGVMEMDRFSDHVRRTVHDVAEISQQMSRIIEQVNSNCESFERVNEGMRSQSEGADQISESMAMLTTNANQTMEVMREYAQAADGLQHAIASLKSSIATFQLKS